MTYLDAVVLAIGWVTMVSGGVYVASKLLSAAAWALFMSAKRHAELMKVYTAWKAMERNQKEADNAN